MGMISNINRVVGLLLIQNVWKGICQSKLKQLIWSIEFEKPKKCYATIDALTDIGDGTALSTNVITFVTNICIFSKIRT